ncbi:hypothetical protein CC79DRAFT_1400561 [Sarocladium strictum]
MGGAAETLLIQWARALSTGEEMTSASFNGSVVSAACGTKLVVGSAAFEVYADAQARGTIAVTIQDKLSTYDLTDGGICSGFWASSFAEVRCNIPLQDSKEIPVHSAMETVDSCFLSAGGSQNLDLPFYPDEDDAIVEEWTEENGTDTLSEVEPEPSGTLAERQICPMVSVTRTRNPRNPQMYRRHVQLTPSFECGAGKCTIGKGVTHSTTQTAQFGKSAQWVTGGFSVSRSRSYSVTMTCMGEANERLCIRHMNRFQGYDTDEGLIQSCTGQGPWWKGGQQRSPLRNDAQSKFYCARGGNDCRNNGWVAMHHVGPGIHRGA